MTGLDNAAKNTSSVFSENIVTVPNLLTCMRMILIVPFVLMFLGGNYTACFTVLVLSALTDFLDGFIARSFNQMSQLGKFLDPLADKLTLFAVGFCVAAMFPRLLPIVAVLIVKDLLMIAGSVVLLKKEICPPSARWFGKAATVSFYVSAAAAVAEYLTGAEIAWLLNLLFSATLVLMLIAVIGYYKIFKSLLNYS